MREFAPDMGGYDEGYVEAPSIGYVTDKTPIVSANRNRLTVRDVIDFLKNCPMDMEVGNVVLCDNVIGSNGILVRAFTDVKVNDKVNMVLFDEDSP